MSQLTANIYTLLPGQKSIFFLLDEFLKIFTTPVVLLPDSVMW